MIDPFHLMRPLRSDSERHDGPAEGATTVSPDPYAQRGKTFASLVQRLRGWVGSDPSRAAELSTTRWSSSQRTGCWGTATQPQPQMLRIPYVAREIYRRERTDWTLYVRQ